MDAELKDLRDKLTLTKEAAGASIRAVEAEIAERQKRLRITTDFRAQELRSAHPALRGELDEVLIHHFGGRVLDDDFVRPVRDLVEKLKKEARPAGEEVARGQITGEDIPVLFLSREEVSDREGDFTIERCALVRITPRDALAPLLSTVAVTPTSMHAFSEAKADVQSLVLSLVGPTALSPQGLTGGALHSLSHRESFSLHETHTAEGGHGVGMPSDYSFRDSVIDEALNLSRSPHRESRLLVGWGAIEQGVAGMNKSGSLQVYRNLRTLLRGAGFTSYGSGEGALQRLLERLDTIDEQEADAKHQALGVVRQGE